MSTFGFFSLLKDIITTNMGKDTLPEPWMDKSESQVQKLLELSNNMWQCGLKTAKHFCLMLFCHIMQILQTVLLSVLFPVDGDCVFIDGQLWAGRLASVSAQCCSSLAISFVKSAAGCATTVQGSRYWWHRLYKWGELLESKSICCFVNCNILTDFLKITLNHSTLDKATLTLSMTLLVPWSGLGLSYNITFRLYYVFGRV